MNFTAEKEEEFSQVERASDEKESLPTVEIEIKDEFDFPDPDRDDQTNPVCLLQTVNN